MAKANDLRSKLKATSIKKLKKRVDEDNEIIGAYSSNEYLNLEDGKTKKIRIFPAHPDMEDFYVPKKCYWLSVAGNDGDMRRTTVLDSKVHGGTKMDLVEEFVKFAKKKWSKDSERLSALTSDKDSLNPSYTWLCYADVVSDDNQLKAKVWEFKKMVRDALNKLAFSEDEDEAIEVDPFTDVDEGLPVNVKYLKNPNKKKGENYYEVTFPKKVKARPLTDEEIEYFMTLKPLSEVIYKYGLRDFEKALEGLQNFDEEHELEMFEDEDWLELVEEIKVQYDEEEEEKPAKKSSKKPVKKTVSKVEDEDEDEEEEEKPAKKSSNKAVEDEDEEEEEKPAKKSSKKPTPVEDDEEDEDDEEEDEKSESEDELDDLDRDELKKLIKDKKLEVSVKKSMSEDDLRDAIRKALSAEDEDEEDDDEEEDEAPKSKVSLSDIKKKLAGKK